jgi:glycosyltransferase involved in cell wall biosynthesis
MACGTPVITSNTSSMPEIGGSEAILINPEDPDEIAEKMLLLEKDEALYQRQKKIGPIRAKCFSWQQTAEHLLDLYESIYKRNASRK